MGRCGLGGVLEQARGAEAECFNIGFVNTVDNGYKYYFSLVPFDNHYLVTIPSYKVVYFLQSKL